MPLPMLGKRRAYHYDSLISLRDAKNDTAESATASEAAVEFASRSTDKFKVAIEYADIGGTVDASNFWTISVEVSDLSGGTFTEVGSSGALPVSGPAEIVLSGLQIENLDSDAAWIRVTATETGTTAGDINYSAYITPC